MAQLQESDPVGGDDPWNACGATKNASFALIVVFHEVLDMRGGINGCRQSKSTSMRGWLQIYNQGWNDNNEEQILHPQ